MIHILTSSLPAPRHHRTPDDDIFVSDGSMDEFQAPDYPEEDSDDEDAMDVVDEDEFGDTSEDPDKAKRRKRKPKVDRNDIATARKFSIPTTNSHALVEKRKASNYLAR